MNYFESQLIWFQSHDATIACSKIIKNLKVDVQISSREHFLFKVASFISI